MLNIKIKYFLRFQKKTLEIYTVENHSKVGSNIRNKIKKLIKEKNGILECQECGVGEIWNNKKLVLQLDHKDGNPKNNFIDNLRILCPNCHSQTHTFAGRNVKRN